VKITDTWYIDIPDGDGLIADDDNDAGYFYGIHPEIPGPSMLTNCFFVTGEDDGIDHNGANINIENCWIEDFIHEGIAASNSNDLKVFNTLVKNCGQAIEAGYGTPQVTVDHCTLVENDVGIRFGDSYNWGCEGQMIVTNSILFANADNIKNYDVLTQGPVEGAIDISYSLTNDPEYDNSPGCLQGTPEFDAYYLLLQGSVGIGLANDGSNLGLVDLSMHVQNGIKFLEYSIHPNPFTGQFFISFPSGFQNKVHVYIFDTQGLLRYSGMYDPGGEHSAEMQIHAGEWPNGVFYVVITDNGKQLDTAKIIKIDL